MALHRAHSQHATSLSISLPPLSPSFCPQLATVCAAPADALHSAGQAFVASGQRCVTTETETSRYFPFWMQNFKMAANYIWNLIFTQDWKLQMKLVPGSLVPRFLLSLIHIPLVVVPYIGRNRIKGPSLGLTDFSFNLHIVCALFRVHAHSERAEVSETERGT